MNVRRLLDQRIGDCLNAMGRFWMFTPVMQAANDLEVIRDDFLETGSLKNWAAGLIFAIARHNGMTSGESPIGISLAEVSAFFRLEEAEVLESADDVEQLLELELNTEKYSEFDFPQLDTEFDDGSDLMADRDPVLAIFRYYEVIDQEILEELEALILEELEMFNEDEEEEDQVNLLAAHANGNLLELELEGFLEDIELFCSQLEENDLSLEDIRHSDDDWENRYKPSPHYKTFMEQFETMSLDNLQLDNISDLEQLLQSFVGKTPEEIRNGQNQNKESQALIKAIKAFDLPVDESKKVSEEILSEFPRCVEAHICLAGWETNRALRLKMLEQALGEGEKDLNLTEIETHKLWWLDHRTRPYMRAMRLSAEEYIAAGEEEKGFALLWNLLEMDESDHMGNRLLLFELSVLGQNWLSVEELLNAFPSEDNLVFVYGRVIFLFNTIGTKKKTRDALRKAFHRNRYPLRLVAGLEEYPEEADFFTPGDKLEATTIVDFLLACFAENTDLAEFFVQELHNLGAWESTTSILDITKNDFVPSAKIIPIDRRSDN